MNSLSRLRAVGYALLTVAFTGLPAAARAQPASPPAYIAHVEGAVTLEHDGQAEPAVANIPLVGGDRLFTDNGRAEIVFPDGTSLEVADNSEVDFDSPTRYRVSAGSVEKHPVARNPEPSPYLPDNLQPYSAELADAGTWEYESSYGYVWYPTVAPTWRPYVEGYWSNLRPYGWTWIGLDRWSWPTHHYGRWGYGHDRWFWVPGRTWGPAYVSWGVAANFVSWCPLGPNNAPLFGLSYGAGHPWSGWTFVPRSAFGIRGSYASRHAVQPSQIARSTPFIQERTLSVARPAGAGRLSVAAPPKPAERPATAAAPANFPLMGDFRRPQPDNSADRRRPIQSARTPAAAARPAFPSAPRAAVAETPAVTERPPAGSAAAPAAEPRAHVERSPAQNATPPPTTAAPPARPSPPSRGQRSSAPPSHTPTTGRSGRELT